MIRHFCHQQEVITLERLVETASVISSTQSQRGQI